MKTQLRAFPRTLSTRRADRVEFCESCAHTTDPRTRARAHRSRTAEAMLRHRL